MSKPNSGHFTGTYGDITYRLSLSQNTKNDIIDSRTAELDLREHPVKYKSQTPLSVIKDKIKNRTATKAEYKKSEQAKRLAKRRKKGVKRFWSQERERIITGQSLTREWNASQIKSILSGHSPKFNGKSIQGHHSFSVSKYPHLADKGEIIYPVTYREHLYGWHGGNYKKSLPGKPIKRIRDF